MKAVLALGIMLLTFLGITKAASPDSKAPQVLVQVKFIQISSDGLHPTSPLPAPMDKARKSPGLVGTFTDPQFQVMIRALAQLKGVDLMSAPTVTTKDGQQADIEVMREFAYKDEAGKPLKKNCGVALGVLPNVKEGDRINLDLSPKIVEFEGFVDRKSGWKEPTFKERKLPINVSVPTGQTIVLEMEPRTDTQSVEDTDEAGHVISGMSVLLTSRLFVFITTYLIDPATGKPRMPKREDATPTRHGQNP